MTSDTTFWNMDISERVVIEETLEKYQGDQIKLPMIRGDKKCENNVVEIIPPSCKTVKRSSYVTHLNM